MREISYGLLNTMNYIVKSTKPITAGARPALFLSKSEFTASYMVWDYVSSSSGDNPSSLIFFGGPIINNISSF